MSFPKKAERLSEVSVQTVVEPLQPGDPRYVDLRKGRTTTELRQMQIHLEDQDANDNRFAKIAFIGHRGSGKSTELLRLEHDLKDRFTAIHLYADEDLIGDFDYTDMLLWLAESLARRFAEDPDLPDLNKGLVNTVGHWFAEKTVDDVKTVKASIESEIQAEAKAKAGFYCLGLSLLARVKSMVKGDVERRNTVRQQLRNYGSELVNKVNLLLNDAASALQRAGRGPDLLVVQDNLDRLSGEVARRLYFDNGELLKRLRAHFIFSVPIAMVLSPWNIGNVFENTFSMPMLKPKHRNGKLAKKEMDALVSVLEARLDIDGVFSSRSVARYLAQMNGGSVRDLIRLLNYAQLSARAKDKLKIDMSAAKEAVRKLRLDYEKLLVPGQAYYPVLAWIHQTKQAQINPGDISPEGVDRIRAFLRELLFNGSVLEYNGDQCWYDVHSVIPGIQAFKDATDALGKPDNSK
ncbi:MAG: hypothetical protein JXQ73_33740 [Phycisphaerae bacterium]|nr:hypothetical protein [Phycisphaerae bacterium]